MLMEESAKDAITIIEPMVLNDHQSQYNRNPSQSKVRTMELNINNAMLAQNRLLIQTSDELTK